MKPDLATLRSGCGEKLANGFKQVADGVVVAFELAFQLSQLLRQLPIRRQYLAQAHKRAHDSDTGMHRDGAVEHAGQHDGAVLRKDPRSVSASSMCSHLQT